MKTQIAGIFCLLAGVLSVNLFSAPDATANSESELGIAVAVAPASQTACRRGYSRDENGKCEYDPYPQECLPDLCHWTADRGWVIVPEGVFPNCGNSNWGDYAYERCFETWDALLEFRELMREDCGTDEYFKISRDRWIKSACVPCPDEDSWEYSKCVTTEEECAERGGRWVPGNRDQAGPCQESRPSVAVPPAPPFTIPDEFFAGLPFGPPATIAPPATISVTGPECSSREVIDEVSGDCRPRVLSDCEAGQILVDGGCLLPRSHGDCFAKYKTMNEWGHLVSYKPVYDESVPGNCREARNVHECNRYAGENVYIHDGTCGWRCPTGTRINHRDKPEEVCEPIPEPPVVVPPVSITTEVSITISQPDPPTFEEECEATGGIVVDSDATNSGKACFYPVESNELTRTPEDVQSGPEAVQNAAAQLGIAQASYAPVQQIKPSEENRLPEYAAPAAIIGALAFSSLYPDYELGSSFNYSGEDANINWEAGMRGDFHHGSFSSYVSAIQSDNGFAIESGTTYQSDSFLASYTTVEAKDYMSYAVQLSAPWKYSGWNISPNLSSQFHYDRDENHSSSESGAGLDLEYRF